MAEIFYEGSVKKLWKVDASHLEFEYTDSYSVFDWGRMPDDLPGKGESLAALGAYFFEKCADPSTWKVLRKDARLAGLLKTHGPKLKVELALLEEKGLKHHFVRRSAPNRLIVKKVEVHAPKAHFLSGQNLYHYQNQPGAAAKARLVPLEVVFRFGIPKGSSLLERLTPEYTNLLGFKAVPKEGVLFETPILEFFSKLEETDRFLSWEQALNYSGLQFAEFEKLVLRTLLLALWLAVTFEGKGLELWDGKFEWALVDGELVLVDSIGPDELRLIDPGSKVQLSKEFLRLFYRPNPWYEAVKDAKKEAASRGETDWKKLVLHSFGSPPPLPEDFLLAATALYPSLALAITGENPQGLGMELPELLERMKQCRSS